MEVTLIDVLIFLVAFLIGAVVAFRFIVKFGKK